MKTVYSFLFIAMIFGFALADDTTTAATTAAATTAAATTAAATTAAATIAAATPKAVEAPKPSDEKPKDGSTPLNVWQQFTVMGEKTAEAVIDASNKVADTVMGIKPEEKKVSAGSWQDFFLG